MTTDVRVMHRTWPILTASDDEAALRVLRSGSLLKGGAEVAQLEDEWAAFTGAAACVATDSCTHALHAALLAVGVTPGTLVAVPALGFPGTAHAVMMADAEPVFIDVDPVTYSMDPPLLRAALDQWPISAVILVHLHGVPGDVKGIVAACGDTPLVEDCCQAHGALVDGQHVGTFGSAGCFSLNEVKNLPAGQGGLIITNSERIEASLRDLAGYGRVEDGLIHTLGFSYGLQELPAAIARSQLLHLPARLDQARRNAETLTYWLSDLPGVQTPVVPSGVTPAWHKYRLVTEAPGWAVKGLLGSLGVPVAQWQPHSLAAHPVYWQSDTFPVATRVAEHSVMIGTERHPIIAQPASVIERDAAIIRDALRRPR